MKYELLILNMATEIIVNLKHNKIVLLYLTNQAYMLYHQIIQPKQLIILIISIACFLLFFMHN